MCAAANKKINKCKKNKLRRKKHTKEKVSSSSSTTMKYALFRKLQSTKPILKE